MRLARGGTIGVALLDPLLDESTSPDAFRKTDDEPHVTSTGSSSGSFTPACLNWPGPSTSPGLAGDPNFASSRLTPRLDAVDRNGDPGAIRTRPFALGGFRAFAVMPWDESKSRFLSHENSPRTGTIRSMMSARNPRRHDVERQSRRAEHRNNEPDFRNRRIKTF